MNWLSWSRRGVGKQANPYLMTSETNPEVLAVCYAQGWCASPDYMTYEEAADVSGTIDNIFLSKGILHFDEFEYFTGITRCPSFAGNTNMTTIKLPPNITYVVGYSFRLLSKLSSITIPAAVTEIRPYAFDSGPSKVIMLPTTPPTLASANAFADVGAIYVPSDSVSAYKSANVWSDIADRIQAIPN